MNETARAEVTLAPWPVTLTARRTGSLPAARDRPDAAGLAPLQVLDVPAAGRDLRFGVGIHETTFRVNVRWVTPLGEETASTS
jgi:hypothetical protein